MTKLDCTYVRSAEVLPGWKDWLVTLLLPRECSIGGSFWQELDRRTRTHPVPQQHSNLKHGLSACQASILTMKATMLHTKLDEDKEKQPIV